ncbi:L-threonylcarbamoyladenylate synthase [Novosphingopyxis sp.]|uniref:L-threonylcarbamoyladenylate synthase n=1 Tax=Novosphingopyxis sp. TaxID=2709690 RepID=UPI003B58BD2E
MIKPATQTNIAEAAALLRVGEAVALPTETVYGLAADAASADAVAQIYRIKGRPSFNPLIVHVRDLAHGETLAHFDQRARDLAARFWPGPLTLVLPRRGDAPLAEAVTAGLPTVALRCPAHDVMQAVLRTSGLALAAPSANRSGAISPSEAVHVAASLGDRVQLILDGGPTRQGLESTIVKLEDHGWRLLRTGPLSPEELIEALGSPPRAKTGQGIEAPGQLANHYAPVKPLRLNAQNAAPDEWWIGFGPVTGDDNLSSAGDLAEAAAHLYAALHRADAEGRARIAVAPVPEHGIGAAINDRLRRAAAD